MQTIHLKVSKMSCGACVKHVQKAIESVLGVKSVQVDLAAGTALVTGELEHAQGLLIEALQEAGYPSEVSDPSL